MAYLWDLFSWKITSIACLLKLQLKSFLVFLIFKSSFTVFCDCVWSSNMIKKVLFLEKQFTNRFNSLYGLYKYKIEVVPELTYKEPSQWSFSKDLFLGISEFPEQWTQMVLPSGS